MSLLVILAIGVLMGWLVNLLAPTGRRGDGLADIALGTAGAFVAGGLAGSQFLLEGVTGATLAAAALGAVLLAGLVHVVRYRSRRMGRLRGGRDGERSGWPK